MKEILLTSSVLILALLVLREVFREKISRRVQYALWGLVALRLLIPGNLPGVDFSVLSVSEPARIQMEQRLEGDPIYVLSVQRTELTLDSNAPPEPAILLPIEGRYSKVTSAKGVTMTSYALSLEEALGLVWIIGMGCMAAWMVWTNLRFGRMLRKKRIPLELPECKYPVFLMEEGLVSPCLFGVFKPAVYLTPGVLESDEALRHVLAHEETHGRHQDPVWALLRNICLAVYWFDPLVWWAAAVSKEDCELACDEGALTRLGEDERIPYGQTLLRLIPLQKAKGGVLLTATTMTSDKKRMKERIMRIAENKKMKTAALCALLVVVTALCAVTFTGCTADAAVEEDTPDIPTIDLPVAVPAEKDDAENTLLIPLKDLVPYVPARVETLSVDGLFDKGHHDEHDGHHGQQQHHVGGGCRTAEGCGTFAWSYNGNVYVSSHHLAKSSFPSDYFLCMAEQAYNEEPFTDVLGHDGVMISYIGELGENKVETINDYYVFEDNEVYLLARVYGVPYLIDLNGDGTKELVGTDGSQQAQIFFQRGGSLYEVDLEQLLGGQWRRDFEAIEGAYYYDAYYSYGWSEARQYMNLTGYVPAVMDDGTTTFLLAHRQVYFDGANLYLYKPERKMTNHIQGGIQELNVVTDAARELAKERFGTWTANYGKGWSGDAELPEWDDYCVTAIDCVYPTEVGQLPDGIDLIVYKVGFEFHSPTPERVVWAGGVYVNEDGWVGGFFMEDSPYLVFQILDDGSYKLLENYIISDVSPGSSAFDGEIAITLMQNQLMLPSDFSGETLYHGAVCSPLWFMDTLAPYPELERGVALMKLLEYADGAGEIGAEHLQLLVEDWYDHYSVDGKKVAEQLKALMVTPIFVQSFGA